MASVRDRQGRLVVVYEAIGLKVRRHTRRFIRFGMVGASGVIVNFLVLTLLVEFGNWHYLLAGLIATESAIISNFTLNDRWTFKDKSTEKSWLVRLSRYHAVALVGLILSVCTLAVLTTVGGLHYLIANLGAVGIATLWNYAGNLRFTWVAQRGISKPPQRVPSVIERSRKLASLAGSWISKVMS